MQFRILVVFTVFFTVNAFDYNIVNELSSFNPQLAKCVPSLRMLDASGKIPSGIFKGNLLDLGNFDECLETEEYNNKTKKTTLGKYCMVKIGFPLGEKESSDTAQLWKQIPETANPEERMIIMEMGDTLGLSLGWCIPNECSVDKLTEAMDDVIRKKVTGYTVKPISDGMCQTKNDLVVEYTTNDILIIIFFAITLLLLLLSTTYDLYIGHYERKPAHVILLAFSVKTNGKKLLTVSNQSNQLSCLHGIRFISMMWVLYGHRYHTFLNGPITNLFELQDWLEKPINQYILNAPVSVDTFFVLSGMLVSYVYCLAMDKGTKFNIILFYIHRYLRLTPVLAVVIWFHTTLIRHVGSGPFWPLTITTFKNGCDDYWWGALLYIQNYNNPEKMCVGQTWYLSVDMQLFILSPLLLIPLWKWPKRTMAACSFLILASIVISFVISYTDNLTSIIMGGLDNEGYMNKYYLVTHCRFGPWVIGFMLGYYLFKLKTNRENKINLSPVKVLFGWLIGLGLLLTTLFSAHELVGNNNTLDHAFFNALHRHGWSLGLCWVIFACTQGYGGPINRFLSWSVFQVLSKFTYTMYLCHYSLMFLMIGASRTNVHFNDFYVMYLYWGDFMLNLAICVPLTLAFESPMMTIEKVLFGKGKTKKQEHPVAKVEEGCVNESFETK